MAVWPTGWNEVGWLSGLLVGIAWVAVWSAGWDETGWLSGLLVGMRLDGCLVYWLG